MSCTARCQLIRCPACPPGPTPAIFTRLTIVPHACPCKSCGAWALILDSGADKPFYLCYVCDTCAPAPAPSHWRAGRPTALNRAAHAQLALF